MPMRLRLLVSVVILALVIAACGSAESSAGWTFGPGLSAAPSGEASAAPSGSAAPSASASAAPAEGPTMTDEALGVEQVVGGLTEPTGMAFLAPDDFFVIEKSTGEVHRVVGGEAGEPVLDLAVNFFDERGLLGIAVHPQFAENGYVYLYWTASGQGEGDEGRLGPDTDAERELPDLGNRVDRFVWDGTALTWDRNIVAMRSNTLETDTSGRVRGNHDAGPLTFGADGTLYIVNGDQNLRGQLQNLPEGPPPDDANFTGVVLRLNDDGSVPEDNPFVAAGTALGGEAGENVSMIWAYGVRNTFGLAVHPETGALWQTENGDDSWDEINVFPAGSNSGWIQLIGPPERFGEYKELEVASEDGLDNPDFPPDQLAGSAEEAQAAMFPLEGGTYVPPVFSWKYPVAVTSIGFTTGDALGESSANTAWLGTVLTDSLYRYPLAADGSGFDFGDDQGLADKVDDNTEKGDVGESEAYVAGTGFGIVTHILPGPDELLYVVSLSAGSVYRIGPADQVGAGGPGASPEPSASASAGASPGGGDAEAAITIGTDPGSALLFDPETATAAADSAVTLTFQNESTVPHNLTFQDPINVATSTIVSPGAAETLEFTAPAPGDYPFVCTLHPGMDGVLTVEPAG